MNFKALSPAHFSYFQEVLGLSSFIADPERVNVETAAQPEVERLVLVNENLDTAKQDLLDKILAAMGWQTVERMQYKDWLLQPTDAKALMVFDRALEEEVDTFAEHILIAPRLSDLVIEPNLKKPLWRDMQAFIKDIGK